MWRTCGTKCESCPSTGRRKALHILIPAFQIKTKLSSSSTTWLHWQDTSLSNASSPLSYSNQPRSVTSLVSTTGNSRLCGPDCSAFQSFFVHIRCSSPVEVGHHTSRHSRVQDNSTYRTNLLQTDFKHIRPIGNHGKACGLHLNLSSAHQTTIWIAVQRPICVQVNRLHHGSTNSHATGDNWHITTISIIYTCAPLHLILARRLIQWCTQNCWVISLN